MTENDCFFMVSPLSRALSVLDLMTTARKVLWPLFWACNYSDVCSRGPENPREKPDFFNARHELEYESFAYLNLDSLYFGGSHY